MHTREMLTDLIDRELRMRGSTLAQWAAERAVTAAQLVDVMEGGCEELAFELREAIGLQSPRVR